MSLSNHQAALKVKHETLEAEIEGELQRPMPDQLLIAKLKKQKLSVKQRLA